MVADSLRTRSRNHVLGRVLATVTIATASLHIAGVGAHGVRHGIVLAIMALACVRCVPVLWNRPSANAFGLVALMSLVMLAVHFSMLTAIGHPPGHHHGGISTPNESFDPVPAVTLVVASFEALLATSAVFATTRGAVNAIAD